MKKIAEFDHPKVDRSNKLLKHVLYSITLEEYMLGAGAAQF